MLCLRNDQRIERKSPELSDITRFSQTLTREMPFPLIVLERRHGRSLRSSALVREALQKRPKSRSPNSRVPECHVTVAGWASWKHHLGGFDAVGKCRCSGGLVKSSAKLMVSIGLMIAFSFGAGS